MQVKNLHSYAYFGTKQFPVDIPIICDSSIVNKVIANPTGYNRTYTGLTDRSPAFSFQKCFGTNIWSAVQKTKRYIAVDPNMPTLVDIDKINNINRILDITDSMLLLDNTYTPSSSGLSFWKATHITTTRGTEYNSNTTNTFDYSAGTIIWNTNASTGISTLTRFQSSGFISTHQRAYPGDRMTYFYFDICPDDIILNGTFNPAYNTGNCIVRVQASIYCNNTYTAITSVYINTSLISADSAFLKRFLNIDIPWEDDHIDDIENPYGEDGTSTQGGGDGDLPAGSEGLDFVDPTEIPELPDVSAVATGFITMYNPTSGQLSSLGNFLWSGQFDLDTYKKLFADPMQGIIGLGIVPALPTSGGSRNIMFGNVDTGINCNYLGSQYASKDCGSINIQKYVGSFMDYSPYVKISMFLPYIGFVNLGTDDIMGGSINVKYNIDVLTGDCIAFIKHNTKGVLYAYHGNCLTNVPVSGQNYANALKNYYESVAGIIPATTNGAAGGPIGAIAGAATGALNAASNVVLNSKPTFQRSGNIGGSAGILGVQKPFVIIERPNISVPNKVQHYLGQTSNITMGLGECSGLTVVEAVHLNGISATSKELAEIDSLLKGGVIL